MEVMLIAEDVLGEELMRRLIAETARLVVYQAPPMGGISVIKKKMNAFLNARKSIPHIILVDLDRRPCAPSLLQDWGFSPVNYPEVCFRVAVREVEAWLLADREGIAELLQIALVKVPTSPESLENPKQFLVNLARRSKSRRLREEMVPADGSSAQVGPLYNSHLTNFVRERWSLEAACELAPSLARARDRLREFGLVNE